MKSQKAKKFILKSGWFFCQTKSFWHTYAMKKMKGKKNHIKKWGWFLPKKIVLAYNNTMKKPKWKSI
jgi:hypothetical protein